MLVAPRRVETSIVSGSRTLHASKEDCYEADASLFSPPVSTQVDKRRWVGMVCEGGQRTQSVQRGGHARPLWHNTCSPANAGAREEGGRDEEHTRSQHSDLAALCCAGRWLCWRPDESEYGRGG